MRDYGTTAMNAIVIVAVCTCVYVFATRTGFTEALEMAVDMYSTQWQRGLLIVAAMFIECVCPVGGSVYVRDVSIVYIIALYIPWGEYTC